MGISVGCVGVGSFGQSFVPLFQNHPLVDRIALCDVDQDKLSKCSKEFGISEVYSSLEDACKSDLDALIIITQHWLHAPQAVQAMEAGKHVYSAVPIISLDNGDEMLDWCEKVVRTSERTGTHYMMGETSYFRPEAMYCRRRAAAGDFGKIVHAEGAYLHDIDSPECSLREVLKARWGKEWDMHKSGDVPMHYPTHSLGGFLSVTPAHATHVSAFGFDDPDDDWHRADTKSGNVFGNETALLQLSDGSTATIKEYRRVGTWTYEGFSMYGTQAAFLDTFGRCMWATKDAPPEKVLTVEEMADPLPEDVQKAFEPYKDEFYIMLGHGGSHPHLVHEFVDAINSDRMPAINAWLAARMMAPAIMAHKSVEKGGERLEVPDWGDPPSGR
jgi:predicted dehydrogenase